MVSSYLSVTGFFSGHLAANISLCNYFIRWLLGFICNLPVHGFLYRNRRIKRKSAARENVLLPERQILFVNDVELQSPGFSSKPLLVRSFQNLILLLSYIFIVHAEIQLYKNVFRLKGSFCNRKKL